ncbi:Pre protein translocase subunit Sec66-domain-containing protein [Jimgerdemannia flammicorona]|uniref:Pre protein translocase subunit Sec66-domain-containing protein n=1 Tax=Jimgerdemannia flammicorona TaxID=994334 RepID=A0A433DDP5_9FUNG|nr:Pre protein translocase subunit Sec66-domain-containing protein [Jimgerdemannia flammicorona]
MTSSSSLLLPTLYLGGCVIAMSGTKSQPLFGPNEARDQYYSLLSADKPVPELFLKSALLRRGMEAVKRVSQLQVEKQTLQQLMRQGTVGDSLWVEFQIAEQQEMAELQEIVGEANTFREGWGQFVLQTAAQMVEHEKLKELQVEMGRIREKEEKDAKKREEREKIEEEREKVKKEKERERALEELLKAEESEKKKGGKKK